MTGDPAVEFVYVNVNGGHTSHVLEARTGAAGFLLLTCLHHLYLLPSTIVCYSGDSAPASLAFPHWDTPSSQPRARSITPLLLPLASCSSDPAPASCDPTPLLPPPSPPASQGSYIRTIRRTLIFLPNLGGESYSLKNTVSVSS